MEMQKANEGNNDKIKNSSNSDFKAQGINNSDDILIKPMKISSVKDRINQPA